MSLGAEQAGATIVWAGNHWRFAVDVHRRVHPEATVVCQDLRQADFTVLRDLGVEAIVAGPACQGHSQAAQPGRAQPGRAQRKGVRRTHDEYRSTAWAVIDAVECVEPRLVLVENVPQFRDWRLYPAWRWALQTMGYAVTEQVLTASRWGVPQRRQRLFVVAVRGRHGVQQLEDPDVPEPPIGPCIEWDVGPWHPVSRKSKAVRARVRKGRASHGERFLTQHVSNHPGVGLHEPIRTVTTQDQWAAVKGYRMRPLTVRENLRAMSFPDSFEAYFPASANRTDIIRAIGNAVPPVLVAGVLGAVRAQTGI